MREPGSRVALARVRAGAGASGPRALSPRSGVEQRFVTWQPFTPAASWLSWRDEGLQQRLQGVAA